MATKVLLKWRKGFQILIKRTFDRSEKKSLLENRTKCNRIGGVRTVAQGSDILLGLERNLLSGALKFLHRRRCQRNLALSPEVRQDLRDGRRGGFGFLETRNHVQGRRVVAGGRKFAHGMNGVGERRSRNGRTDLKSNFG